LFDFRVFRACLILKVRNLQNIVVVVRVGLVGENLFRISAHNDREKLGFECQPFRFALVFPVLKNEAASRVKLERRQIIFDLEVVRRRFVRIVSDDREREQLFFIVQ